MLFAVSCSGVLGSLPKLELRSDRGLEALADEPEHSAHARAIAALHARWDARLFRATLHLPSALSNTPELMAPYRPLKVVTRVPEGLETDCFYANRRMTECVRLGGLKLLSGDQEPRFAKGIPLPKQQELTEAEKWREVLKVLSVATLVAPIASLVTEKDLMPHFAPRRYEDVAALALWHAAHDWERGPPWEEREVVSEQELAAAQALVLEEHLYLADDYSCFLELVWDLPLPDLPSHGLPPTRLGSVRCSLERAGAR